VDWARCFPDPGAMRDRVRGAFACLDATGRAGDECWADYSIKLEAWRAQRGALAKVMAGWPSVCAGLAQRAWSPQMMRRILRAVALPESFEDLDPAIDESEARTAFLTAHWIRRRFTLGDLIFFLGWDREALWTRLSEGVPKPPERSPALGRPESASTFGP
jgi:glycerol-1-phosphate dehydrogenase [NAD(P)+]